MTRFAENTGFDSSYLIHKKLENSDRAFQNRGRNRKKFLFLKNEPNDVVENKGSSVKITRKRTENEPKTKLSKLLKTKEAPKNEPETNRKTSATLLPAALAFHELN